MSSLTSPLSVSSGGSENHRGISNSNSNNNRYLCSAPRPEQWSEYEESVLKSLGKNKAERIKVLNEVLQRLKELHPNKRTGPGRKSNAEHALNFYEHLLEMIKDDGESSVEGKDEENSVQSGDEQAILKDEPRVDLTDKDLDSMNSVEFCAAHNDLCEVCEGPGQLLMCSTCNLSFHLTCVRPVMNKLPPNDEPWRCSYCVLSSEPKNTKARREAASAVRLMARLRNSMRRNKRKSGTEEQSITSSDTKYDDNDIDDREVKRQKADVEGENKTHDDSENVNTVTNDLKSDAGNAVTASETKTPVAPFVNSVPGTLRKGVVAYTTAFETPANITKPDTIDSTTADLAVATEIDSKKSSPDKNETVTKTTPTAEPGRAKRTRKQPQLYDPQIVPASKWQSDETPKHKTAQSEKMSEDKPPTVETTEKVKSDADGNNIKSLNGREYWCAFCHDDPTVAICCFCACRVCFGKHSQTQLLLCDHCDEEYHTFCLNPPLTSVPTVGKWYCPKCEPSHGKHATSSSKVSKAATTKGSVTPTRTSGRKPVPAAKIAVNDSQPVETVEASPAKKTLVTGSRPRGRPRKTDAPVQNAPTPTPKKRGRPPKNAPPTSPAPPKKRGRPSKSKTPKPVEHGSPKALSSSYNQAVKGVAAKASTLTAKDSTELLTTQAHVASDASMNVPIPEPAPIVVSRSGRTVKRSTFHDEIEEGEQHLRMSRSPELSRSFSADKTEDATKAYALPSVATHPSPERISVAKATKPQSMLPSENTVSVASSAAKSSVSVPTTNNSLVPTTNSSVQAGSVGVAVTAADKDSKVTPAQNMIIRQAVAKTVTTNADTSQASVVARPSNDEKKPSPILTTVTAEPLVPKTYEAKLEKVAPQATAAVTTIEAPPLAVDTAAKPVPFASIAAVAVKPTEKKEDVKVPRRKPGARECMQISRRFGVNVIPQKYMDILLDYCSRGKVEHLVRMRERLDEHSRFLESQLAGLEAVVKEKGESDVVVPPLPQVLDKRTE